MNNAELAKHVQEEILQWKDTLAEPGEYNPESVREHAAYQLACSEATLAALTRLNYLEELWELGWHEHETQEASRANGRTSIPGNEYQEKLTLIRLFCQGVTPYVNSPFGLHDPFDGIRNQARLEVARSILDILEDKQ